MSAKSGLDPLSKTENFITCHGQGAPKTKISNTVANIQNQENRTGKKLETGGKNASKCAKEK